MKNLLTTTTLAGLMSLCLPGCTSPVSKMPAPSPLPTIHIVFDSSGSMCGFLKGQDHGAAFLNLIKEADNLNLPGQPAKLFLLRQMTRDNPSPQKDIQPALPEFLTIATNSATARPQPQCTPFTGQDTNLDLMFDEKSTLINADTVILISDALLSEKNHDSFLSKMAAWVSRDAATPHIGMAIAPFSFGGRYYPIGDPNPSARKHGYALDNHKRPLVLFWFTREPRHLPHIQKLINALHKSQAKPGIVQHFLPEVTQGEKGFINHSDKLADILDHTNFIVKPTSHRSKREVNNIKSCFNSSVNNDRLLLIANRQCEGQPIFSGVTQFDVSFASKQQSGEYSLDSSGKMLLNKMQFRWQIGPQNIGKPEPFTITRKPALADLAKFADYSIDSDFCTNDEIKLIAGSENRCVQKLQNHTFHLETLTSKLAGFSRRYLQAKSTTRTTAPYQFEFQITK